MALKIQMIQGGGTAAGTADFSDWVPTFTPDRKPALDAGMKCENGSACQYQFIVADDENVIGSGGTAYQIGPHNVTIVSEDAPGYEAWLARGRVSGVEGYRYDREYGVAVAYTVTSDDANVDLRGLALREDWVRGSESGRARVIALRTAFLNGDPRVTTVIQNHLIASGGEVTMPAKTYPAGTTLPEILDDCAEVEGKVYSVVIHHQSNASHLCLLYIDEADHTTYASTLSITDTSPNFTTSFPPIWDQGAAFISDGQEVVHGMISRYGQETTGFVISENTAQIPANDYWLEPYNDSVSVTASQAAARIAAIAESKENGHVTHQVTIKIPASSVDLLCAGMSINIRSSTAMGGGYLNTTQTRRIAQLKWEMIAPEVGAVEAHYYAHMQLDRPQRVVGTGPGLPVPPKPNPPTVPGDEGTRHVGTVEGRTSVWSAQTGIDLANIMDDDITTWGEVQPYGTGTGFGVDYGANVSVSTWRVVHNPAENGARRTQTVYLWSCPDGSDPTNGANWTLRDTGTGACLETGFRGISAASARYWLILPGDKCVASLSFSWRIAEWYLGSGGTATENPGAGTDTGHYALADHNHDEDYAPINHSHGAVAPVESTSDPTVDDDTTEGYELGQVWVNTTTDTAFILVDNGDGAAVWHRIPTDTEVTGAGIGVELTKHGQILTKSGSGSEANRIDSPTIFWDHERQRWGMVYTGYSESGGNPLQASLHLAYSDDLLTWTKYGSNPILSASGSGADSNGCTGGYIYYEDGVYHLFYIGLTSNGYEGGTKSLCRATASDPQGSWSREGSIISPAGGSVWYSDAIWHPNIVKRADTYYLFFNATGGGDAKERIGYATATALDGAWTVNSTAVISPTGTGADWDGEWVADPSLYRIGDYWYMAYSGKGTGAADVGQDGIAWCHDDDFPDSWTRFSGNPVLTAGGSGAFDEAHAHKPFIVSTSAGHFHFYTAIDGSGVWSFGLATAGGQREPVITPEMVQAVGRWEPVVTNPGGGPELVFDASGDIVVTFVRTL